MCISPFVTAVPPVKEKWGHVRDHVGCPGHELVGKTPFKICAQFACGVSVLRAASAARQQVAVSLCDGTGTYGGRNNLTTAELQFKAQTGDQS